MAAEIFTALSNLRMILDTETDADSPNDETLNDAYRYAVECLLILLLGTGGSGSATSDPSNDSNGYFYDSAASFANDQHNGRTLVMTSGAAKGNMYTIDDTVAASDRLDCTGDNLYSDGVRSGDDYIILYDIKVNADGHDHDGVNSKMAVMPLGRTLVACSSLTSSTLSAAWQTRLTFSIYIPANPTTLSAYLYIYTENATEYCAVRFQVVDSASTTFTSSDESTTSTTPVKKTLTCDLSAAAAGHASLSIQLSSNGTSYNASVAYPTVIWNT